MTLTDCHPTFQETVNTAADESGKDPEQIYAWWREYCDTCRDYDQSPVWSEFEQWYAEQLAA